MDLVEGKLEFIWIKKRQNFSDQSFFFFFLMLTFQSLQISIIRANDKFPIKNNHKNAFLLHNFQLHQNNRIVNPLIISNQKYKTLCKPITARWCFSIPSENTRKPLWCLMFSGGIESNTGR